jgi:hypothetical protein
MFLCFARGHESVELLLEKQQTGSQKIKARYCEREYVT